ncbi:CarD family transcriptional regulator [Borreliella sinica]|uniref:CarD family transcriptional regulator n=1 Tax=Borreliella sinica TaxID=87162 RepID=UPI002A23D3FE|nr:CarD family transcriptional regulator [Borreliella sinica]WPM05959.1 CarD family transcriptional regulator [Borreliella sinica]
MAFLLNQSVVYPMHGVGTITDIRTKEFNGQNIDYYEIHFPFSDMIFMVPVAKVDDFGIRALVSREKVEEVFDVIKDFEGQIDSKKIKDGGHEFYKKSDILDTAKLYKFLYKKSTQKELPFYEKRILNDFELILEHEISLALQISFEEAKEKIKNILVDSKKA